jgi:hypothetical protein
MERISREDDENLYQPKLHSDRVRELYVLKERTGVPMTVLIDRAVAELVVRYTAEYDFPVSTEIEHLLQLPND